MIQSNKYSLTAKSFAIEMINVTSVVII